MALDSRWVQLDVITRYRKRISSPASCRAHGVMGDAEQGITDHRGAVSNLDPDQLCRALLAQRPFAQRYAIPAGKRQPDGKRLSDKPLIKMMEVSGCRLFSKRRRSLKLFEKSFTKNFLPLFFIYSSLPKSAPATAGRLRKGDRLPCWPDASKGKG